MTTDYYWIYFTLKHVLESLLTPDKNTMTKHNLANKGLLVPPGQN